MPFLAQRSIAPVCDLMSVSFLLWTVCFISQFIDIKKHMSVPAMDLGPAFNFDIGELAFED